MQFCIYRTEYKFSPPYYISVKVAHDYDLSQGSAAVHHCVQSTIQVTCDGKGKGHPITSNEGPEGE